MALPDEAFTTKIDHMMVLPGYVETSTLTVRHHITARDGRWVNIEFGSSSSDAILVDWYADPEDLERLGILFQYLGKTAREKRDGSTDAA